LNKNESKKERKELRQRQHAKQQKIKNLIWITAACLVALFIVLLIFKPKADPADFAYDQLPRLGSAEAPIKIVEFGDYKCPSCKYFSDNVKPQLVKDYVDTGKVAFYFMNFTIIDPDSTTAAYAGQAVYKQNNDAFWKYFDALFKNQGEEHVPWATSEFLTDLAKKENLPIDYDKMKKEIDEGTYADVVKNHYNIARQLKLTSTPSLFLNGKPVAEEAVFDYAKLKEVIEKTLKGE